MKNKTKYIARFFTLISFSLLFCSCLGLNIDIALNNNGGGIVSLEYRISQYLETLGKLDGNEMWNTIPAGRADFERTLDRLPEMKLLSFSSREDEKDTVISARIEFQNINSLLAFLDAEGSRSSFSGDGRSGRIGFILSEGSSMRDEVFFELIRDISASYTVAFNMSFPGEGNLTLNDSQGRTLTDIPGLVLRPSGRNVSVTLPLYEILSSTEGINLEFSW